LHDLRHLPVAGLRSSPTGHGLRFGDLGDLGDLERLGDLGDLERLDDLDDLGDFCLLTHLPVAGLRI